MSPRLVHSLWIIEFKMHCLVSGGVMAWGIALTVKSIGLNLR